MSIEYCYKHDISYDTDFVSDCELCEEIDIENDNQSSNEKT